MMLQYLEIKKDYPDHLLFYRLGDFYEMFFDDAKTASRELELVLTGRDCGEPQRAPMCGIPYHSTDSYIAKLIEKGYKIAICEQAPGKTDENGLMVREVVRIITPGTVVDGAMLSEDRNNYLCAICIREGAAALSFCDIGDGIVYVRSVQSSDSRELSHALINEFSLFNPSELLLNCTADEAKEFLNYVKSASSAVINAGLSSYFCKENHALVETYFKKNLEEFGISDESAEADAVSALLAYLAETKQNPESLKSIELCRDDAFLLLDAATRRNLELTATLRSGDKRGTLLGVLDRTKTSLGARLLRRFIDQPLVNCRAIDRRQGAVQEFYDDTDLCADIRALLSGTQDIERLLSKLLYGTGNGRDVLALGQALSAVLPVSERLKDVKSDELCAIYGTLKAELVESLGPLSDYLIAAIDEKAPLTIRDGNIIKKGFDPEVDEVRSLLNESNGYLTAIEQSERELTGIKGLKIGYNKVFGYYLEVTNSYLSLVPERYIRKQTLTGGERFITQELKDLESRILSASARATALEYEVFCRIVKEICRHAPLISKAAGLIAHLDVYAALADVARTNNYVRPEVDYSDVLVLKDARHPVVETLTDGFFVPNDVLLDTENNRMAIITGPNMAGKSTYMRQTALIVILAQIGSFVPAKSARIGIVDQIFTRIGASDDLGAGQSTFMLEMSEVASILRHATKKSLIIYDEIGRGTSTFDGMSIAQAVVEYTAGKKLGARTMFATHYHELAGLETTVEGVKNYHIAAKKRGDTILFLRKIVSGFTDDSYGIEVAQLAGVPKEIVNRAKKILAELEADDTKVRYTPNVSPVEEEPLMPTLFDSAKDDFIREVAAVDVNTLTPIEAMSKLFELAKKAKEI
ncbi:MAG: DNA mismatch repair protein MutS [Clostridia bacterium]|nr:DNA mismatch repair protein MutS [Clostridia bacterium]